MPATLHLLSRDDPKAWRAAHELGGELLPIHADPRRLWRALRDNRPVTCWGDAAARRARWLGPGDLGSRLTQRVGPNGTRIVIDAAHVVCPTPHALRRSILAGADPRACVLDLPKPKNDRPPVRPDNGVLRLLIEPCPDHDENHRAAILAAAVATIAGFPTQLVCPGRGRLSDALGRFARALRVPLAWCPTDEPTAEAARRCAGAIVPATRPSSLLAYAAARAAGLPVVAVDTPWLRELAEAGDVDEWAVSDRGRVLTRAVLRLHRRLVR